MVVRPSYICKLLGIPVPVRRHLYIETVHWLLIASLFKASVSFHITFLFIIMYAERTNTCYHVRCWPSCTLFGHIYIIMYVAVSHVRSNVKWNTIKICPLAGFLRFLYFPSAVGAPAALGKRKKKASRGSGLNRIKPNNWLSCTFIFIIMYTERTNIYIIMYVVDKH